MKIKTEKLVKRLKKIKALEKQNEIEAQMVKPAVRIQELKNKLIILGHDLKVNKKINDSLYRKIQLLTYSRTTEKKLNESYDSLKDINKQTKLSVALGEKVKKATSKDFKKSIDSKKATPVFTNTYVKPYDIDGLSYLFNVQPTTEHLTEVSNHYLTVKKYKRDINRDYEPKEQTEHKRKKTFVYDFNGSVTKILGKYLYNIFNQQKFTFKLTIEFSYLLISVDEKFRKDKKTEIIVEFDLHYSSTNTRPKEFKNPVVVDNKKDIESIIKKLTSIDLIE